MLVICARNIEDVRRTRGKVCLSPDGKRVTGTSIGNTLRIWDTTTGQLLNTFHGNSNDVCMATDVSGSGSRALTCFRHDGTRFFVQGHDVATGKQFLPRALEYTRKYLVMRVSANGKVIVTCDYHSSIIDIWDAASGMCVGTIMMQQEVDSRLTTYFDDAAFFDMEEVILFDVYSLDLSADGSRLVTGNLGPEGGTICVWDLKTSFCRHILKDSKSHRNSVLLIACAAISADGKTVASSCDHWFVRVWNADTGALKHILKGHRQHVNALAVSADGSHVVSSSSYTREVKLWDTATGKCIRNITARTMSLSVVSHKYWTRRTHMTSSSMNAVFIAVIASSNSNSNLNSKPGPSLPDHLWEYVFSFFNGSIVVALNEERNIQVFCN